MEEEVGTVEDEEEVVEVVVAAGLRLLAPLPPRCGDAVPRERVDCHARAPPERERVAGVRRALLPRAGPIVNVSSLPSSSRSSKSASI